MPTWSPGPTPSDSKRWATCVARRSSSPYVRWSDPMINANRSGTRSAVCSKRSAMLNAMGGRLEPVSVFSHGGRGKTVGSDDDLPDPRGRLLPGHPQRLPSVEAPRRDRPGLLRHLAHDRARAMDAVLE